MNIHHNPKSHCFDGTVASIHHNDKYNKFVDSCEHNTLVAIEMTACLCSIIGCGENLILYYLTVDLFEVIENTLCFGETQWYEIVSIYMLGLISFRLQLSISIN